MIENVILRRCAKRSIKEDLAEQQLNTALVNSFKSGRGTGWLFSIGKIIQSGVQGNWTYEAIVTLTCEKESKQDNFNSILEKIAENLSSGPLQSSPWIISSHDGYKTVAEEAIEKNEKNKTLKKKANEEKELGEVNLEITNEFDHIFGREAHIRRVYDVLKLGKDTDWNERNHCLLYGSPGCHIKGTRIILATGDLINIENVNIGDKLLSYNGFRTVKELVRGYGKMYEINPIKGKSFIVNEDHILTLSKSRGKNKGSLLDVSVKDWINWSNTKKTNYKLIRSESVEFLNSLDNHVISPYLIGFILGDFSIVENQAVRFTSHEDDYPFIKENIKELSNQFGLNVIEDFNKGKSGKNVEIRLSGIKGKPNPLILYLKEILIWGCNSGNKFIPKEYKTSSVENRLKLIAGYIDADGEQHGNVITTSSKSKQLSEDIAFIARSLGFAAYISEKNIIYNNQNKVYYVVNLSGNLEKIPSILIRKKCSQRKQIKNVLRTGFSVKYLREDYYYGIKIDGDNRYLMEDFTITHNCGKTEVLLSFAKMLGEEDISYAKFDATSMTKAGVLENLIENPFVPPVLIIEEIEKCEESALRWLLGVMDSRGEIRRTNYRVGNQAKNVKMVVLASANDLKLLESMMAGALYSRFTNKIFCDKPDRETLCKILTKKIERIPNKNPLWIDETLKFGYDELKLTDPRDLISICVCGRDRLLDGTYQEDYRETTKINFKNIDF